MKLLRTTCFTAATAVAATLMSVLPGAHAAELTGPVSISGIHGHACSYTQPEYSINSGGANLEVTPGHLSFSAWHTGTAMEAPYITEGYYNDKNTDSTRDYGGCNGRTSVTSGHLTYSPVMPVKIGKAGRIYGSLGDWTSPNFRGDTGYDIWFNSSKYASTYNRMANGGVEIMLWTSSIGLGRPHSYSVRLGGHRWGITYGLAAYGHGRSARHPAGWNVVNFVLDNHRNGYVKVTGLYLNPFISYAIRHGWLRQADYLMALDQGGEMWHGSMYASSTLKGLR